MTNFIDLLEEVRTRWPKKEFAITEITRDANLVGDPRVMVYDSGTWRKLSSRNINDIEKELHYLGIV